MILLEFRGFDKEPSWKEAPTLLFGWSLSYCKREEEEPVFY